MSVTFRAAISPLLLAAALFAFGAADAAAQSRATIREFEQLSTDSFRVHVKILCNGTPLYGLAPAQFAFRENEQPLTEVTLLKAAAPTPDECFDAALVISRSASMSLGTPQLIDEVKSAAKLFVDNMRTGCDRAAILSFGSDVGLDAFLTQDKEKLKSRIDSISTSGNLALWDAVFLSLLELESNGTHAARASIIITNGEDNSSLSARAQDVLAQARATGIALYVVSLVNKDTAGLKAVAIRSGGGFYSLPSGAGLPAILAQVSDAIRERHQLYEFEYHSSLLKTRRRLLEITASGCTAPLTVKQYYDTGLGGNPPAPFQIGAPGVKNTDLFRLDRIGCTVPEDFLIDTLRIRWQLSSYVDPYLNDTVRYTWNALLDSSGRQLVVSFPADNQGFTPAITLDGRTLYTALLSRGIRANPDSLLLRIPWFISASNSYGQTTFSDTAGVSRRNYTTALPATPALMLAMNRPPTVPDIFSPAGDSLTYTTPSGPDFWTAWNPSRDFTAEKGIFIGGFRNFNSVTRQWESDPNRRADTVVYQLRIQVVAAFPAGKGSAPGTSFRISAGAASTLTVPLATLDQIFGGFGTLNRADSVWIRIMVDAHDFNQTNARENVTFDSVWSGTGCRPHLVSSPTRMVRLVYRKDPVNVVPSDAPAEFILEQNYPNPFSASTTIPFRFPATVSETSTRLDLELKVFDLLGREVLDLTGRIAPESRQATIESAELPQAGVYIYRLRAGHFVQMRKMTRLR